MQQLDAAVSRLAGRPLDGCDGATLGGQLIGLRRLVDRLEAEWLRQAAAFDATDAWQRDGAASAAEWIAARCTTTDAAAVRRGIATMAVLEELPATATALADGDISIGHAHQIADLAQEAWARRIEDGQPTLPGRDTTDGPDGADDSDADGAGEAAGAGDADGAGGTGDSDGGDGTGDSDADGTGDSDAGGDDGAGGDRGTADGGLLDGATEARLLDAARGSNTRAFRPQVHAEQERLDADAGVDRARRQHRARSLRQWTRKEDGMVCGHWALPPDAGAVVAAALEAQLRQARTARDPRSIDQQRADALVALSTRATTATGGGGSGIGGSSSSNTGGGGSGGGSGARVSRRGGVIVVVDWATLVGRPGGPPALLSTGEAICAETARRLACDADVSRMLLGPAGAILDFGRSRRTASDAQVQALEVRDGGCVFPDCGAAAYRCQAHHLRFWDHGGPTDLANLALLCWTHHHAVHEGGWHLAPLPHGAGWQASRNGVERHWTGPPLRHTQRQADAHRRARAPAATDGLNAGTSAATPQADADGRASARAAHEGRAGTSATAPQADSDRRASARVPTAHARGRAATGPGPDRPPPHHSDRRHTTNHATAARPPKPAPAA